MYIEIRSEQKGIGEMDTEEYRTPERVARSLRVK